MAKTIFNEFNKMHEDMTRFLDHLQGTHRIPVDFGVEVWRPNVNIYESETMYFVLIEVSGANPDDIKIVVQGDTLYLQGIRNQEFTATGQRCLHMEILSGPFKRSIQLPGAVDSGKVRAEYKHGMLEISLEKIQRDTNIHEVPISS